MQLKLNSCTLVLALIAFLASSSVDAEASASTTKLTVCDGCSSHLDFAYWAEHSALTEQPVISALGLTDQDVYVINSDGVAKFFRVTRKLQDSSVCCDLVTRVQQGEGDPALIKWLLDASSVIAEIGAIQNTPVELSDLDLENQSTVDFVGPENGPAGLSRNGLRNRFADYIGEQFRALIDGVFEDPGISSVSTTLDQFVRIVIDLFGPDQGFTVIAPDGTTIRLVIAKTVVANNADGTISGPRPSEIEIDESSVSGPNLPGVPQYPGQFDGFSFEGEQDTGLALYGLSQRFGGLVVCEIETTCHTTETGQRCEATVSC